MRLLVTRPEPDASRQAEGLCALGHVPVLAPLLRIEMVPDLPLGLGGAQALIATSRNALRALAFRGELASVSRLPLFAVGEKTSKDAAALGFANVIEGPGTGEALAEVIGAALKPGAGPLVHLSGETVAFDLKSALEAKGFTVLRPVVYRSVPASELPQQVLASLQGDEVDGVILMSPRTAATFAGLVGRYGLETQAARLVCYCLSGAVAKAVEPLGARMEVAASPREEDVLALVSAEVASS